MAQSEEKKSIFFSVIIPIYKVEDCLRKCVDSVLQQTFKAFEVLLIDDGSPDNCPAICEEYAAADKRVRVIHKQNGGLVSARNTGIKNAVGSYICYVDGDDWVEKDWLIVLYRELCKAGKPDMAVYNAYYEYDDRTEQIPSYVDSGYYNKERLVKEIYPYMMYDSSLPFFTGKVFPAAWNKVYRRELLAEHYCREEQIGIAEDNAFTFECLYYANSVSFCKDVLYHYNRCNEGSMISRYNAAYFEKSQLMCHYLETRLSGIETYLDNQINVFLAAWVIMAVFHEIRFQGSFLKACKSIKEKLGKSDVFEKITLKKLPFFVRGYLWLLRHHAYHLAGIGAKLLVNWRKI